VTLDLNILDDGELASLAAAGRQAAFVLIVRRHRDALYRLGRAHIGDAEEALDIVQEAFFSAHAALGQFEHGRSLRAWLSRIALNKCRDWGRRRRVRLLLGIAAPLNAGAYAVVDPNADPWREVDDRRRLAATAAAITKLPNALKEPLLLCAIEELSQAEAADALGISVKAVETRLRRARLRLRAERLVAER